jgi:hypothetical protein
VSQGAFEEVSCDSSSLIPAGVGTSIYTHVWIENSVAYGNRRWNGAFAANFRGWNRE